MLSQEGVNEDGNASNSYENFDAFTTNNFTPNFWINGKTGEAGFNKIKIGGINEFGQDTSAEVSLDEIIETVFENKVIVNSNGVVIGSATITTEDKITPEEISNLIKILTDSYNKTLILDSEINDLGISNATLNNGIAVGTATRSLMSTNSVNT